ncbi:hypothetical protein [Actinokineospora enzanensis]|uniref:hypothetical protein n=1 Tax=Actinokineospora enzanensis TaxID=155975 RepID=UPI00037698C5|nr:hypothetical protein [Actinokineospora enzanensis]
MNGDLLCPVESRSGCLLVRPRGVLDPATYPALRDTLLKCAVAQPRAVVVDLGETEVGCESLLSVFATVWLRTCDWPGVPLLVVGVPEAMRTSAVRRYVRFHDTAGQAVAAAGHTQPVLRRHFTVPRVRDAAAIGRNEVAAACVAWGVPADHVVEAEQVVTELVENTMRHTDSEARVRVEARRGLLTVAVTDDDPTPAVLRDRGTAAVPSAMGLLVVTAFAKTWGCVVDRAAGRKVVWAVLRVAASPWAG